jgi:hypothetical protein
MYFRKDQFQQRTNKVLCAEISELGVGGIPSTIYIGGQAFVHTHTDKDASGEDVMGWNFKPTMGAVAEHPELAGTRVLIIND